MVKYQQNSKNTPIILFFELLLIFYFKLILEELRWPICDNIELVAQHYSHKTSISSGAWMFPLYSITEDQYSKPLTTDLKLVFCVHLDCLQIQLRQRVKMSNFDGSDQDFSRDFISEVIGEAEQHAEGINQSESKTEIV